MKLTQWEGRWAEAAIGAIFPGSLEEGFADIRAMDVPGFLQQVVRTVPFKAAFGLRVAIWLVALAPLVLLRRFATIAGLALEEREVVVARLVASKTYAIRSLVMILKTMGALLYAGDDAVRSRLKRAPALAPGATIALRRKPVHAA
jgi:hypothetical protein